MLSHADFTEVTYSKITFSFSIKIDFPMLSGILPDSFDCDNFIKIDYNLDTTYSGIAIKELSL